MRLITALLSFAVSATALFANEPQGWTLFRSSDGFTVSYPSGWNRIGGADSELDIVSRGNRDEGVIIGPRQAEIRVRALRGDLRAEIADWTHLGLGPVLHTGVSTRGADFACDTLDKVSVNFSDGLGEPEHDVGLFCQNGGRLFLTSVRFWKDDPSRTKYEMVAMRVARSLRPY